jgi:hypothetical protein
MKRTVTQVVKKFCFMEPEGSLPCPQEPTLTLRYNHNYHLVEPEAPVSQQTTTKIYTRYIQNMKGDRYAFVWLQ